MAEGKPGVAEDGVSVPFAVEDVVPEPWSDGMRFGSRSRRLGKAGGACRVGVVMEEVEPGRESTLAHYHLVEEEQALILSGEVTLRLGEKTFRMKEGDYVVFPAGQRLAHSFYNHGAETCRFLMIGTDDPHDVTVYPESGRIGVRALGEGYDGSAKMDYWQGIDSDGTGA